MFDLKKIINGRMNVPEPEYHTASVDIEPGMALKLDSNGKLAQCGQTETPTFISLGDAKANGICPAAAVASNQMYDVAVIDSPANLKVGNKVKIAIDAKSVTANTDGGVATIVSLNGATAVGDKITVRF